MRKTGICRRAVGLWPAVNWVRTAPYHTTFVRATNPLPLLALRVGG